jgi:hypothetical protein
LTWAKGYGQSLSGSDTILLAFFFVPRLSLIAALVDEAHLLLKTPFQATMSDGLNVDRIDQDIRINELREAAREAAGGEMHVYEKSDTSPEIIEQILAELPSNTSRPTNARHRCTPKCVPAHGQAFGIIQPLEATNRRLVSWPLHRASS